MMSTVLAYLLGFATFLAFALWMPRDTRFLAPVAAISYSVYLLHDVVIRTLFRLIPGTGGWTDIGVVLLALGGTLILASLVYRWIEVPFMAIGRRLSTSPPPRIVGSAENAI